MPGSIEKAHQQVVGAPDLGGRREKAVGHGSASLSGGCSRRGGAATPPPDGGAQQVGFAPGSGQSWTSRRYRAWAAGSSAGAHRSMLSRTIRSVTSSKPLGRRRAAVTCPPFPAPVPTRRRFPLLAAVAGPGVGALCGPRRRPMARSVPVRPAVGPRRVTRHSCGWKRPAKDILRSRPGRDSPGRLLCSRVHYRDRRRGSGRFLRITSWARSRGRARHCVRG